MSEPNAGPRVSYSTRTPSLQAISIEILRSCPFNLLTFPLSSLRPFSLHRVEIDFGGRGVLLREKRLDNYVYD